MTSIENWMPIKDWPGYEVSDFGRVRSYWRRVGWRVFSILPDCEPAIIKGSFGQGYPKVRLSNPNEATHTYTYVHLLVLEAFVGTRPDGMECCHRNGDRSDASLANLRWDTPKANQADKITHGTHLSGCSHHHAKLSDVQIREIFNLAQDGLPQSKIGKRFGVDQSTICRILRGARYREQVNGIFKGAAA